jgi:hypothetical protein
MKELSIDEKAEAYDKALERVKDFIEKQNPPAFDKNLIGTIFPELKESEDEKIRKEIINYFAKGKEYLSLCSIGKDDILAWLENIPYTIDHEKREGFHLGYKTALEKQGKKESNDKNEPKFHEGDWVLNNVCLPVQIALIKDGMYIFTDGDALSVSFVDETYHLWTLDDANPGDMLSGKIDGDNYILIFKQVKEGWVETYGHYYDVVDRFCAPSQLFCRDYQGTFVPATKEQRDTLFAKIKEAGYEWDAEKKELKKIEQKPACSDDKKLTDVNHEYFSELLENNDSEDINDYAYQVAYCMSHDWIEETATWDDVQKACKLGAKWQKKHDVSEEWNKEDEKMISRLRDIVEKYAFSHSAVDVNGDLCEKEYIEADNWLKSLRQRCAWKPSIAQLNALSIVSKGNAPDDIEAIVSLYNDLKKLTE